MPGPSAEEIRAEHRAIVLAFKEVIGDSASARSSSQDLVWAAIAHFCYADRSTYEPREGDERCSPELLAGRREVFLYLLGLRSCDVPEMEFEEDNSDD